MALKRSLLKTMGLNDEQINAVIEAHTETVEGLKSEISKYKDAAEKLPGIQKELEQLKEKSSEDWEDKYIKEHDAFEKFKGDLTQKEAKAAKEKAVRAYFESKGITGNNLELAIRGSGSEIGAIEMDGEKIKNTDALDALISGVYSGLVTTTQIKGADPKNPPSNGGGNGEDLGKMSMSDYIAARKTRKE